MTATGADPTPRIQSEPGSLSGGAMGETVAPPSGWLECDIATLKDLRIRTLALAKDASAYDTRLQRMFTDVEAEIRRALAALLLQREDQAAEPVVAPEARCPACKQPQSSPSCQRREHWGVG